MDDRIILTVKRVAGFVTKAQWLVVLVFGGARVDTRLKECWMVWNRGLPAQR